MNFTASLLSIVLTRFVLRKAIWEVTSPSGGRGTGDLETRGTRSFRLTAVLFEHTSLVLCLGDSSRFTVFDHMIKEESNSRTISRQSLEEIPYCLLGGTAANRILLKVGFCQKADRLTLDAVPCSEQAKSDAQTVNAQATANAVRLAEESFAILGGPSLASLVKKVAAGRKEESSRAEPRHSRKIY